MSKDSNALQTMHNEQCKDNLESQYSLKTLLAIECELLGFILPAPPLRLPLIGVK